MASSDQQKAAQCSKPSPAASCAHATFDLVISILPWVPFSYLTYTAVDTILHGDAWDSSFAVSTYALLVLLLWSAHQLGKVAKGGRRSSVKSKALRVAVWSLATLLNFLCALRVSLMLESVVASCVVWVVGFATSVFGFVMLFFCYQRGEEPQPALQPLLQPDASSAHARTGTLTMAAPV